MAKMLGVLTPEETATALAKAAAEKIASMTPEAAKALVREQDAEAMIDDPAKVAADNQAMGRFAYIGCAETTKLAGSLMEEGHELPAIIEYLEGEREKFAAEIAEIPDDQDAIDLAAKIDEMAQNAPEVLANAYDTWKADQAGDGGGGEGGAETE